jgi:hypothetical protein
MDLLDQAVENAYLIAAAKKLACHRTADEASAARDENPFPQFPAFLPVP